MNLRVVGYGKTGFVSLAKYNKKGFQIPGHALDSVVRPSSIPLTQFCPITTSWAVQNSLIGMNWMA